MARRYFEGSEAEVLEAIALEDAEAGNPKPGTHIGRGPHADMPATWDGTGDAPPGWTRTWAEPRQHPTNPTRFAMVVRDAAHEARLASATLGSGRRPVNPNDFNELAPDWGAESN